MHAVGRRFNVFPVGHFSAVRPPKNSEFSKHVLKSLATPLSSSNGRGLQDLWGLFQCVVIQLFIHHGMLATELWASDFLKTLWGGIFLRSFLGQLWLNVFIYIYPHTYPGALEKTRGGAKNDIGIGKRVVMVGTDGFSRGSVTKRQHVQNKERGVCLWGGVNGQVEHGWVHSPWHYFQTSVDRRSSLFIMDKELAVS